MVPVAPMVTVTVIALIIVVMPRAALATLALVFLPIALSHPLLLHKVHGLSAGTIASAVSAPVLLIDNRHVEVDGLLMLRFTVSASRVPS